MTSQIHVAPLRAWLAERPAAWRIGAVLIGSWVIAASSWISAPMYPVPMTMQTFAVLLVAGMAGARLGFAIVATWLTQAALGLPFLADGAGGLDAFSGPTAGYLAGFALAAFVCGWLTEQPQLRAWAPMLVVFLVGHALILACGWGRLALLIGAESAFASGGEPFLIGAALKSVLAVAVVKLAEPRMRAMQG
jgi:biotin transport system substrate-specific component